MPTASRCAVWPGLSPTWRRGRAPASCPPTTSPAGRSRSPTRAPSARSSPCRSSTSPRWRSSRRTASSAGRSSSSCRTRARRSRSTPSACWPSPSTTARWTGPTRRRSCATSPVRSRRVTGRPSSDTPVMNPIGGSPATAALRVRWLGRVRYRDAHALQRALFRRGEGEYLLLLEHPHVYTLGVRARAEHVLVDPAAVGAELVRTDRGGDVTYHGPGQLVGYPVLSVPIGPGAVPAHVARVEQLVIDTLAELGLPGTGRLEGYPGVWVDPDGAQPRKICAIGVRVNRGRSMHGFALNVAPDMAYFGHIVPCGIADKPVTSLAAEGVEVAMDRVV